jgi:hypothetical protein
MSMTETLWAVALAATFIASTVVLVIPHVWGDSNRTLCAASRSGLLATG